MNLELREQVAKAMGHKKHSWPFLPGTSAGFPQCVHCGETLYYHEPEKQAGWCYGFNPPPFEDDIAAAWLVVEFMAERGWSAEIETGHGLTYARFKNSDVPVNLDSVESIFPAEAICRAALAALEASND